MGDPTIHIGLLTMDLFIPQAQSLKNRRSVVKSMTENIRRKFNVSAAQVDGHDLWQRAVLAVCMIAGEKRYLNSALDKILKYAETFSDCEVIDHTLEFI